MPTMNQLRRVPSYSIQRRTYLQSLRVHSLSRSQDESPPEKSIVGYHIDDENHWVAELECGHFQHVRHDPPMVERPWVLSLEGRNSMLGYKLLCKKCVSNAPKDTKTQQ